MQLGSDILLIFLSIQQKWLKDSLVPNADEIYGGMGWAQTDGFSSGRSGPTTSSSRDQQGLGGAQTADIISLCAMNA